MTSVRLQYRTPADPVVFDGCLVAGVINSYPANVENMVSS